MPLLLPTGLPDDIAVGLNPPTLHQPVGDGPVQTLELRKRLSALDDELNRYLSTEYGVEPSKKDTYVKWLKSHQPFHWFVEFYGIMSGGGFDVIIGNPPYVELNAVNDYQLRGFECEGSGNLYALVLERCAALVQRKGGS